MLPKSMKMSGVVLDAWALLAWLGGEPGAVGVRRELRRAERSGTPLLLSAVNAGEVYYRLAQTRHPAGADEFLEDLRRHRLPIRIVPATNRRVWEAARLKARYRISYADAFAAALAREARLPLITGDADFAALEKAGECSVRWLASTPSR